MRVAAAVAALAALAGCAGASTLQPTAPEPDESRLVPVALRNADFELAPRERCATHWNCTAHSDANSFTFRVGAEAGGRGQALCMERVKPEPWAVASQGLHDASLAGAAMRMAVRLRAEGLQGNGAGPFVLVHSGSGGQLYWGNRLVKSTRGWETITYDFVVPAGAAIVEVGVTLEGPGRACLDDIQLWRRSAP